MRAVRLTADGLKLEQIETPEPGPGDALIRVHAAAITKDELEWPTDRLPAIPSYELSGEVVAIGPDANGFAVGDEVYALSDFGRVGEPNGGRLAEITRLVDAGELRPAIASVYPLDAFQSAFERLPARGKRGKVVLQIA